MLKVLVAKGAVGVSPCPLPPGRGLGRVLCPFPDFLILINWPFFVQNILCSAKVGPNGPPPEYATEIGGSYTRPKGTRWWLAWTPSGLFAQSVTSQEPLAAALGRVLGQCTGDNLPSLAGPRYKPIGPGFSGPGRFLGRPSICQILGLGLAIHVGLSTYAPHKL